MPKEACRLFTLTVLLFGILCMAKGLSTRKEPAINSLYHKSNKDLNDKRDFYGNNEGGNFYYEYFREKRLSKQNENGLESNVKIVNENIIQKNNINQLKPKAGLKNQLIENNEETFADPSEYYIKIVKKKGNDQPQLRSKRKNPLSYLHINHDSKYNQPEMYIINASNFNEDVVRRLTRSEKRYDLPICDISESPENIHTSRTILNSNLLKRGLSTINQIPILAMDTIRELKRKVRSQWRFRKHNNDLDMINNKYKSPIEYNQNNLEKSNTVNTDVMDEEKVYFHQSNEDDNNSKNSLIKRSTIDEEAQMSSIVAGKDKKLPSKKEKNKEKKNELFKKSVGNKLSTTTNKSDSKDSVVPNENLSSLVNITSEQVKMAPNQDLSDQTKIDSTNQSMINVSKEKTEDSGSALKSKTEYSESEQSVQSNITNNDFEHSEKNKIQMTNIQSPIAPVSLPSGSIVPNISYVYVQPLPLGNSMFMNQPKPAESTSAPSKKIDPVINSENKNNDLITISIDPKTLQNKILHAEFMKKSDVKKTPDTLSIELSPKDTPTNSSKHQKTVQKPLKISASVKNNSIFITGGDTPGYHTNNIYEKKNQQYQSFKENSEVKQKSFNEQIDSISSPMKVNDIFYDNSLHENNLQNEVNLMGNDKSHETKVLIINAKQKEVCATEEPCKQMSTYCSIDLCDLDGSHCKRSTWNLQNFREVHEIINMKENITSDRTMSVTNEPTIETTSSSFQYGNKIKREADQMNISKIINLLKPVLVLSSKADSEGSEDESGDSTRLIDKVNLKGSSEIAFEKGNKKVENKILEGFINSIIANYSKDEIKPLMKETTEKSEDGAEALLKLLENSMPKRNERDNEFSDEKKSDLWNLTPILVPESSISKYGDNPEYAKLGPFDENFINSFLKKEYVSS